MTKKLYPEYTVKYISGVMSLREPQKESLIRLERILDNIDLVKEQDLVSAIQKVHEKYPTFTDFERDFMSLAFSLATGVGKTRLMGAFITYLYTQKGIKNFFVIAPNLTIYNKLKVDLSDWNSEKYVFKGIGCFAESRPNIITGEDYAKKSTSGGFGDININIFNIDKMNKTLGSEMRKLNEVLGTSYFKYLCNLEDLVVLMDESHHYRATAGLNAINELKPVLGLELTATPLVEGKGKGEKFKNIVYEYSLAHALKEKFVKTPYVLTRGNIDFSQFTDEELDKIKIKDGILAHERVKVKLELYANENNVKKVKPFALIVCANVSHAEQIFEYVTSNDFHDGYYRDKTIIVHSVLKGQEKEETMAKLLEVEKNTNPIEIVIHVNILKEGWDVNNLYTIIPLRTSASKTLTEQTIGRGLRLPYGKYTGVKEVDSLVITAHENFNKIIEEAKDPNSLINRKNIIDAAELEKTVTEPAPAMSKLQENERKLKQDIEESFRKNDIEITSVQINAIEETLKIIDKEISDFANEKKTIHDINSEESKKTIHSRVKEKVCDSGYDKVFESIDNTLFDFDYMIENQVKNQTDIINQNVIEIPRISVQRDTKVNYHFEDFDLDTNGWRFVPVEGMVIKQNLVTDEVETYKDHGVNVLMDTPVNILVSILIDKPDIDYDIASDLLYKLAEQAIQFFEKTYNNEQIENIIQNNKYDIAEKIYQQMKLHFVCDKSALVYIISQSYQDILTHNYEKIVGADIKSIYSNVESGSIKKHLFNGFTKASHSIYKFDSRPEINFAIVCERDSNVLKWLRPSRNQFNIFYGNGNKNRYMPDFVVETNDTIYLVEVKKDDAIYDEEVQDKAEAALRFCQLATNQNISLKKKPWKYLLIPASKLLSTNTMDMLAELYEYKI